MTDELIGILPDLHRWANKNCGAHYDPEDLVSDVVISFLERPGRYDPSRGTLKKYLFSCMRNRSMDALRAYNRKGRERLRWYLRNEAPLYLVDKDLDDSDRVDCPVKDGMGLLPQNLLEPLRLFVFEGKKCREIAQILGIREGYVRCLIHRARARLRELLASA